METSHFRWTRTALITPFTQNDNIDWHSFDRLIDKQIQWWVTWILFLWTTGENPTLNNDETYKIVKRWISKIDWKCKVMVNAWTYCTKKSIENIYRYTAIDSIDGFLIVNPYYNKPTQEWLFRHFKAIADSTQKPIFIYNIKWRTGVNMETDTLVRLSKECSNIIWVKEASWDLNQIKDVINQTDKDFIVLSWDDGITLDLIKLWWDWVISVASNFIPEKISKLVNYWLKWDLNNANKLNNDLKEFFEWEFIQTNPLPIKTALSYIWLCQEIFRLPLCQMDKWPKSKWIKILKKYI